MDCRFEVFDQEKIPIYIACALASRALDITDKGVALGLKYGLFNISPNVSHGTFYPILNMVFVYWWLNRSENQECAALLRLMLSEISAYTDEHRGFERFHHRWEQFVFYIESYVHDSVISLADHYRVYDQMVMNRSQHKKVMICRVI